MIAQTIHCTITTSFDFSPKDVIINVNKILFKNVHNRLISTHFMTFATLKYTGDGNFIHAGSHEEIIVFRNKLKACERIKTTGIYLNIIENISHATIDNNFSLEIGDLMILYTDGLIEAKNQNGDLFGINNVIDLIEKNYQENVEKIKDLLLKEALQWCNNKRSDDISILVLRRIK
jgi:serine phosphatase RsbU (regulator of sigma subunit)